MEGKRDYLREDVVTPRTDSQDGDSKPTILKESGSETSPHNITTNDTQIESLKQQRRDTDRKIGELEEQSKSPRQENVSSKENNQSAEATKDDAPLKADNDNSQVQELATALNNTIKKTWKERHGSRYKSGKFLIVHWKSSNLKVNSEVRKLTKILLLYNIVVEEYLIPDEDSESALEAKVVSWLEQDNTSDVFKGFLYTGHGKFLESLDSGWTARRKSVSNISSGSIQRLLEQSTSDVLIIYDTCHSADFLKSTKVLGGVKELIAACCWSLETSGDEKHSFTTSLINALKKGRRKGLPVSISTLVLWISEERKKHYVEGDEEPESEDSDDEEPGSGETESEESESEESTCQEPEGSDQAIEDKTFLYRAPVHTILSAESSDRGIILHPIFQQTPSADPTNTIPQVPENEISISFRTSALDIDDISALREWIRAAPPSVLEFLGSSVTAYRPGGSRKRKRSETGSEPGTEQ